MVVLTKQNVIVLPARFSLLAMHNLGFRMACRGYILSFQTNKQTRSSSKCALTRQILCGKCKTAGRSSHGIVSAGQILRQCVVESHNSDTFCPDKVTGWNRKRLQEGVILLYLRESSPKMALQDRILWSSLFTLSNLFVRSSRQHFPKL